MASHLLRNFQFAAVLKVGGDAGGPRTVTTDLRCDTGSACSPTDHPVDFGLRERSPIYKRTVTHRRE